MAAGEIIAVLGSATPPGRLRRALEAALARLPEESVLLDLGEVEIGPAGIAPGPGDDTSTVVERISAAPVVVLATPVYRGSMTGVLKNLLDHLPVDSLRNKPIAIVSMGASDHHYLGADRHLRDVLTFFGAAVVPVSVYLTPADFADGAPTDEATNRVAAAIRGALALRGPAGEGFGPPPIGVRA